MQLKADAYPLPQPQTEILKRVDGKTTITGLIQRSFVPQPQFDRALAALVEAGLIRDTSALPPSSGSVETAVVTEENDLDFTHLI
jgi:hypothetical protein